MSQKYISSVNKSVVSVNNWEDVKKVEQVEDCFILEFDPTIHKQKPHILLNIVDDDDDDDDDDDEIIGSIVCVRKREDVKKVEEFEDCFILEFNPCEEEEEHSSIDLHFSKCSVSVKTELVSDDEEVSILAVKGQVACRDYPHPRHLCAKHPFEKSPHDVHCEMCYCYVCDTSAPCKKWTQGCKDPGLKHCDATPNVSLWRTRRDRKKLRNKGRLQ